MKTRLVLTLLAATLAAAVPRAACADIIAFATTPISELPASGTTSGYTFTLATPVQVSQLGFWDYQGNGLANAVPVTIWNSGGTALASATVPAGVSAGEINQYLYVRLAAPVTLAAGTYTIGGYVTSTADSIQNDATNTPAAGITYGQARQVFGNAYPDTTVGIPGYFGPNFQIVPEPSTWALLGVGVAGLCVVTLRRCRARA